MVSNETLSTLTDQHTDKLVINLFKPHEPSTKLSGDRNPLIGEESILLLEMNGCEHPVSIRCVCTGPQPATVGVPSHLLEVAGVLLASSCCSLSSFDTQPRLRGFWYETCLSVRPADRRR